jgi:hypothetical protein
MSTRQLFTISDTSPATASTAIGSYAKGLLAYDWFTIDALLVGATGGTLDVYLQRQVATEAEVTGEVWVDWLHFTQLAAGAAAVRYSVQSGSTSTIATVASATLASAGTPVLSAGSFIGGHPGDKVRAVYVAGASTSAGAAVKIYITGWRAGGRAG